MFFVNPDVRFSRRFSVCQIQMRPFALGLFRWLTGADSRCLRMNSRLHGAEFPPALQIAYWLLLRSVSGSRATDCASIDALRPNNNWVISEDQYGISIIREKWPATTRRLPQKGRQQSPALPECALARTGEEIVLAENHGFFHRRRKAVGPADAARPGQRFGTAAAAAQA
jgi:hypothetical protein